MREMIDFLTASSSWSGSAGIPERLAAHVYVSMLSMVVAGVIALPAGLWLGHRNRGAALASAVANAGRAIPTLALLGHLMGLPATLVDLGPFASSGAGGAVARLAVGAAFAAFGIGWSARRDVVIG